MTNNYINKLKKNPDNYNFNINITFVINDPKQNKKQ